MVNLQTFNTNHIKTVTTYKDILKLSLPIIAGSAVENLMTIFNTAFLGHVSAVALGAAAIGGIFYLALIMIGFGFGSGIQIVIARRFGEQNLSEIGRTLQHAAIFLLPIGLVFFLTVKIGGNWFFKSIVHSDEVYANVAIFMKYRIWGIFFAYSNIMFKAFYIGILRTRIIGIGSAIIASVNILLDYTLIFGHFGFPQMGIAGAGIASLIAEGVGCIFYICYTLSRKDISQFHLVKFHQFEFKLLGRILKTASPVMFQFFISFGAWFLFFIMVEEMGNIPLAVSNVMRTVYMIVLLPIWGFASATNSLVSYKIGANLTNEVIPLIKKISKLGLLCVCTLLLLVDIFSGSYFQIYTNNSEIIKACMPVLWVVNISSVTVTLAIIIYNALSGTGKTQVTLLIEFFVMIIYVCWIIGVVKSGHGSTAMVWGAEVIYGLGMGSLSLLYLKYGKWKKEIV